MTSRSTRIATGTLRRAAYVQPHSARLRDEPPDGLSASSAPTRPTRPTRPARTARSAWSDRSASSALDLDPTPVAARNAPVARATRSSLARELISRIDQAGGRYSLSRNEQSRLLAAINANAPEAREFLEEVADGRLPFTDRGTAREVGLATAAAMGAAELANRILRGGSNVRVFIDREDMPPQPPRRASNPIEIYRQLLGGRQAETPGGTTRLATNFVIHPTEADRLSDRMSDQELEAAMRRDDNLARAVAASLGYGFRRGRGPVSHTVAALRTSDGMLLATIPPEPEPRATPRGYGNPTKSDLEHRAKRLAAERPDTDAIKSKYPSWICSITQEVFRDPVIASDGHTYEREAIERWLQTNPHEPSSPVTNEQLVHCHLSENIALRQTIDAWMVANPEAPRAMSSPPAKRPRVS